jgi:hypothetical protein
MSMKDLIEIVQTIGVPAAFAVALGYALYKVGAIATTLLVDAWKAKDTRLAEFDGKLERINNGQREALMHQLTLSVESQQQNTAALTMVSEVLERQSNALEFFARERPCIHDSDLTLLDEEGKPLDEKAIARVTRRSDRKKKIEGET